MSPESRNLSQNVSELITLGSETTNPEENAVRNPLVSNALHWIKNNFYKGIQATDVAQAMGVTQQGLQKAFTKSYIRSPGNEIRHQRVQAVAFLLRTTNAKLETIAKNSWQPLHIQKLNEKVCVCEGRGSQQVMWSPTSTKTN